MFIRKSRLGEKTSVRKIYGKLQSYIHDIYWEIVSKYGMLSDVKKKQIYYSCGYKCYIDI